MASITHNDIPLVRTPSLFCAEKDVRGEKKEGLKVSLICDGEKRVKTWNEIVPRDGDMSPLVVTHRRVQYDDDCGHGDEDQPEDEEDVEGEGYFFNYDDYPLGGQDGVDGEFSESHSW